MHLMKAIQRSGKLLISEASAARRRSASNLTGNKHSWPDKPLVRYSSPREAAADQSRYDAFPRPPLVRYSSPRDAVADQSRDDAFPRPPDESYVKKENLVIEDQLNASDFDLPLSEKDTPVPAHLLTRNPDLGTEHVVIGEPPHMHPVYLRDACPCPRCVDPSSTQKTFQTTDIPKDIRASSVEELENEDVMVTWENDVPGFEDHVSVYPKSFFHVIQSRLNQKRDRQQHFPVYSWDKENITANLQFVTYNKYMTNDDALFEAQRALHRAGLLIVRDVPDTETAVEDLAGRIGPIRDSFYGRTWDVKSVPEAKNVAYTHQYLGLHMDLLYMANPPGFQFLHCLENSCEGGESIFVDSFCAASQLADKDFDRLLNSKLAYHYRNAGEHYYHEHRVFDTVPLHTTQTQSHGNSKGPNERPFLSCVNYSPPFQAPTHVSRNQQVMYTRILRSLRKFAARVEAPGNLFEYKLKPGECVIFNNRRVLHGRRQFETTGGKRWLKGAYVDSDVFMSRFRVLAEQYNFDDVYKIPYVFPEARTEFFSSQRKQREEGSNLDKNSVDSENSASSSV